MVTPDLNFFDKGIGPKRINKNYKFDIRFHVEPDVKLMKTQDGKSILIEFYRSIIYKVEGWLKKLQNIQQIIWFKKGKLTFKQIFQQREG